MSRVVPAILTDNPKFLEVMIRQSETFTDYVQLDIMDGLFVPSHSISYQHISRLSIKLDWEAHLMVKNPEKYLAGFRQAGASKVVFHYESTTAPVEVISQARSLGLGIGLAINPDTPNSLIMALTDIVDSVLFLSVHPGFYGSKFIPHVLDKIKEFRQLCPDLKIGIDGGIKEDNIATVSRAGADDIFVGSAIFLQKNPAVNYLKLSNLVK